jgi:Protein of unknown function (DUF3891)
MIVRCADEAVQLITQPDHAALAGRIMERCVALGDHPRRASILRAIAGHDDGWAEVDAAPSIDAATGAIVDFITAPASVRQSVWPRAIARHRDDRWAAALIAHHAQFVYSRYRPDAEWAAFFAQMERTRDELLAAIDVGLEVLVSDYVFLRLGDLISLVFCTGATEEERFESWTVRRGGATVLVAPDLFGGTTVPVEIQARAISNRQFSTDAELSDQSTRGRMIELRGAVASTW